MLAEDIRAMEILKEAETYREIADGIAGLKFGRLGGCQGKTGGSGEERAGGSARNAAKDGHQKDESPLSSG